MLRACSWNSFMLLSTAFLVYVSAAFDGMEAQSASLARQRKPAKLTTKTPSPNQMALIAPTSNLAAKQQLGFYHPAAVSKPRLIERYDTRALDGHYEYRYVLSNGDIRYERADWLPVGHKRVLARKGYYSYPLPNHRFHTVFYTADHMGFHEDGSSISRTQPSLPRSLEAPNDSDNSETTQQKHKQQQQQQKQEQTNKINRKPNWTPTTKSILQKGRIAAIAAQEAGTAAIAATATTAAAAAAATRRTRTTTNGRASAAASSATNRPQINKEKVSEPTASAINVPSGVTTPTTTSPAMQQPSVARSETINPIKAASVQTTAATMETETEQLATVDTTPTVLSVD